MSKSEIIIDKDWFELENNKDIFWHTSTHVLCQAVLRLFPDAKPTVGPATDSGFYYDFANLNIEDQDLKRIEKECESIVKEALNVTVKELSRDEAIDMYKDKNEFKVEIINSIPGDEKITYYSQGEFSDVCRGPHISNTKYIKSIKVLSTSAAYWRGNQENESLTRIYGISFPEKQMMSDHMKFLEEVKKRDHRILGKQLKIFMFSELSAGFPYMLPAGMKMWNALSGLWKDLHDKYGYQEIKTPPISSMKLWQISGHADHYLENMFIVDGGNSIDCCGSLDSKFGLKAMNCPATMVYFNSEQRSHKDLPLRISERGNVFRNEYSGALSGLCRVRSFHQDDAHIFVSYDQIESEVKNVLGLIKEVYSVFGITYECELATRPESSCGTDEEWDHAIKTLAASLESYGHDYKINEGDGAFYGPKIDIYIKDAINRRWQCGTIQLDFGSSERFGLRYANKNEGVSSPAVIHRALFGSFERFMGILIEHFEGKMPLWISGSQISIISLNDSGHELAEKLSQDLYSVGCYSDILLQSIPLGKRIKTSRNMKYNYIVVIGDDEVKNNTLAVRVRDNKYESQNISIDLFVESIKSEIKDKSLISNFKT